MYKNVCVFLVSVRLTVTLTRSTHTCYTWRFDQALCGLGHVTVTVVKSQVPPYQSIGWQLSPPQPPIVSETWASYQIRQIAGCACAGNAGNVFPRRRFQRKLLVSDPGMHHGTCVTHVPWCMSGSLTCGDGENVPGIPGACAPAILRIWQEAHKKRSLDITRMNRSICCLFTNLH